MSDPTIDPNQDPSKNVDPAKKDPDADFQKKLDEELEKRLADIKSKLDGAYSQRDAALAKVAEREAKDREAEVARLREAGKEKEAHALELAELKARAEALEKRNTELSRDNAVRTALAAHPLRNDKASQMAYQGIVSELVLNDKGEWVHKSGITIPDFVAAFAADKDNEFLFKSKPNSGSGSGGAKPSDTAGKPKSLFGMSQAEVMKMAAEGKLPNQSKKK